MFFYMLCFVVGIHTGLSNIIWQCRKLFVDKNAPMVAAPVYGRTLAEIQKQREEAMKTPPSTGGLSAVKPSRDLDSKEQADGKTYTVKAMVKNHRSSLDYYTLYLDASFENGEYIEDTIILDGLQKCVYIEFKREKGILALHFKLRIISTIYRVSQKKCASFVFSHYWHTYFTHMENKDRYGILVVSAFHCIFCFYSTPFQSLAFVQQRTPPLQYCTVFR